MITLKSVGASEQGHADLPSAAEHARGRFAGGIASKCEVDGRFIPSPNGHCRRSWSDLRHVAFATWWGLWGGSILQHSGGWITTPSVRFCLVVDGLSTGTKDSASSALPCDGICRPSVRSPSRSRTMSLPSIVGRARVPERWRAPPTEERLCTHLGDQPCTRQQLSRPTP